MASPNSSIGERRKKPFSQSLIAGGVAGFVESSICHPLDTVKTRLQLLNNHIESVSTRLKHSLVEPAVLHVRHSLIDPSLKFRHSLAEPLTSAIVAATKPKHSLVEPSNLVKLQRHPFAESSFVKFRGVETTTATTTMMTRITRSNKISKKDLAPKSKKTEAKKATACSTSVSNPKNGSAAKCWWNQPKQNHIKMIDTEPSSRPFQIQKDLFNISQLKYLGGSSSKSSNKKPVAVAWWKRHGNSSTIVTSRGQSLKTATWCQQMDTSNVKRYGDHQGRRRFATRANSGNTSTPRNVSVGPIQVAQTIMRKEGFWSFYKGLSAVYAGIIPKMAIRFVAFEQYKDVIRKSTPLGDKSTNFMAGLFSGLTEAVLIVTPAEVCKIRMQSQRHSLLDPIEASTRKYGNLIETTTTIVREEGYSALYKGLVPTMLRQGCNQAVNFTAYNAMKSYWLERNRQQCSQNLGVPRRGGTSLETTQQLPGTISMLIGGSSGAMGPIVNNPLDVVKTRLQKQSTKKIASNAPRYSGMIQACFKIAKEEGVGALWKGITPRLMRIVPGQAITFTTYEAICRRL